MSQLKLTYFDFAGRAEIVRSTLRLGGVAFADERLTLEQFAERKASLPYGHVPVLEVDGQVMAENRAILLYAARRARLYPPVDAPVAALLVDEVIDTFEAFVRRLIAPSFHEKDPEKVKAMRLQLVAGDLPDALAWLDRRLETIASYPLFRDDPHGIYVHEVMVWENVMNFRSGALEHIPTTLIDEYKTMVAMHDKVAAAWAKGNDPVNPVKHVCHAPQPTNEIRLGFVGNTNIVNVRLALEISGVAFEDKGLSSEEGFSRSASSFVSDQAPVLAIGDDVVAAQPMALLRFCGRLTGLYPTDDPIRALKIDEVLSHLDDLDDALAPTLIERDPQRKRVLVEKLVNEVLPDLLGSLERRLVGWKLASGEPEMPFAVGPTVSIADIAIHTALEGLSSGQLDHVPISILSPYGHLMRASKAVASQLPKGLVAGSKVKKM